jgi:hydrogenase expression/formation protein HypC
MSDYDPYDMAYLGKVIKINGTTAIVDFNGIKRDVELGLVEVKEGDYVLVHAGYAIRKINKEDIENELKNILSSIRDI